MSINKVILVGNLTKDAEIRTVGQQQVASFGLATSERFTDRNGQKQELTEFHNIELWGSAGAYPYLKKGTQVYVEGSIKTDKWTDQQGQPHEAKKIRAFTLQLVGQRPQQPAQQPPQPQYQQPVPPQYQQPIPPAGYPGAPQNPQQQSYAPIATPQQAPAQQYRQPAPPPAPALVPQPPMAQQLDPNNYPGDLPFFTS